MAELLILEFSEVGLDKYHAVNEKLGIDMNAGTGDWPSGLHTHIAGTTDDGRFVVTEVGASRDAQADFMQTRLADALAAGGITSEPKVTWATVAGHQTPKA
jgi:hypothetical protein